MIGLAAVNVKFLFSLSAFGLCDIKKLFNVDLLVSNYVRLSVVHSSHLKHSPVLVIVQLQLTALQQILFVSNSSLRIETTPEG